MREEIRSGHPRLEAAIELAVLASRAVWKWLLEHHKELAAARARRG